MKKSFVFLIAALCLAFLPFSCTRKDEKTVTAVRAGEDFTPLVFDNYGRTVTVSARPEKVLALGPNCAETMAALGLTGYIAGTSLRNHSRVPLPEYAEDFKRIPELNHGSATRKAVISSGADFIYGIDWEFGGGGLDVDELAGYGITVYMDAAQTLEQWFSLEFNSMTGRKGHLWGEASQRLATGSEILEGEPPVDAAEADWAAIDKSANTPIPRAMAYTLTWDSLRSPGMTITTSFSALNAAKLAFPPD